MPNKVVKAKRRFDFGDFVASPLALFLGVLACMGATAFVSYKLGDEALEGVVQPTSNPMEQFIIAPKEGEKPGDGAESAGKFVPVNIQQVSKETREYIKEQKKLPKGKNNSASADQTEEKSEAETDTEKKS